MKYCRFLLDNRPHYGNVEDRDGEPWIVDLFHAPEEDLAFRLAHSHAAAPSLDFESLAFEPMPLSAAIAARARHAVEDHLRRPQLSRARQGAGQRSSRRAAALLQAALVAARARRRRPHARRLRARGLRRRAGAGHRPPHHASSRRDDDWRSVVRGYTLANDVTARDLQKKDGQWTRAKGFDTFCPVGPMVSDEVDLDCRPHHRNPRQRRTSPARLDARLHLFHSRSARATSPQPSPSSPAT